LSAVGIGDNAGRDAQSRVIDSVPKSVKVSTPLPVVMVVVEPPAGVMVMLSAGKSVVALVTAFEA
jgi:hypothetical protein